VNDIKLSLAIPYKDRLENIVLAFEGLARQTLDSAAFEVVVAAMEYSDDYVALCREYADRIDIVSVLSTRPFTIPRARNVAMRQASGRVIVHMDADTLLAPTALRRLYDRYFAFGQKVCVAGKVVGYGNNDASVDAVELLPYDEYAPALEELEDARGTAVDLRFQSDCVLPWAFAWTGLIALPAASVREHGLYFDEEFEGWGVDDLEWGYRVCATGIPILVRADVCAIHVPHTRDMLANQVTERENYRRFLRKWAKPDVELAHAFGDVEANRIFLEYQQELRGLDGGRALGTAKATVGGRDVLFVGVLLDAEQRLADPEVAALVDDPATVETLPLVGLALPYDDQRVHECRVLPRIAGFSPRYWDAVCTEAHRVSQTVVLPPHATA
jgi:glycosyltransferase involved in cell wall biosynthesis